MLSLVSDTNSICQCLSLLLSLVRESSFMSWKVILVVILDVNPLNTFGLLPNWLVLLQIKLRITIFFIMTMRYEGTLVSFWCANALWVNVTRKYFGNPGT